MNEKQLLQKAVSLAPTVCAIIEEVLTDNIQRDDIAKASWLSWVSGHPVFFLGTPGVNKTGTIEAMVKHIAGANFYEELMPAVASVEQFLVEETRLEQLDLGNGVTSIRSEDTLGRAAAAHFVFADEKWKADSRLLQTLIDLAKGGTVRHGGKVVRTPLLSFMAASNELPDPDSELAAMWSRDTIRVQVRSLDKLNKKRFVRSREARYQRQVKGEQRQFTTMTLDDLQTLRDAVVFVELPESMLDKVIEIIETLLESDQSDFQWAWDDDRRFGRIFDVMKANALLSGRIVVTAADLIVLKWLLWDTEEQIPIIEGLIAPMCRTPLDEAREVRDMVFTPDSDAMKVFVGDRSRSVHALQTLEEVVAELEGFFAQAGGTEQEEILVLLEEVREALQEVQDITIGRKQKGGQKWLNPQSS